MQGKERLTAKELFAITVLMIAVKIGDTTPSLLAQHGKNAFWLMAPIAFFTILPSYLLLMHLLKKYKDKNLVELIEHILGKRAGKLVGLALFLITFFSMTIDTRNYVEEIKLLYFPEATTSLVFIIFMGVCFFGAKKGFETIGSTAWVLFPYIKITFILLVILILEEVVWQRVFPIWGTGLGQIVMEGMKKSSIFSQLIILTMAYTSLRKTSMFHKGALFGALIVIVEITFFFLLYCTMFDYNSIEKVAFPFHEITQYVNIGSFFTNIETFFMIFWLLAAFIRFILYLYFTAWIFGAVFNIKEFEPLLLPFGYFVVILGLMPKNAIQNELLFRENYLDMITPFFLILPFLLWTTAKLRGEFKK